MLENGKLVYVRLPDLRNIPEYTKKSAKIWLKECASKPAPNESFADSDAGLVSWTDKENLCGEGCELTHDPYP